MRKKLLIFTITAFSFLMLAFGLLFALESGNHSLTNKLLNEGSLREENIAGFFIDDINNSIILIGSVFAKMDKKTLLPIYDHKTDKRYDYEIKDASGNLEKLLTLSQRSSQIHFYLIDGEILQEKIRAKIQLSFDVKNFLESEIEFLKTFGRVEGEMFYYEARTSDNLAGNDVMIQRYKCDVKNCQTHLQNMTALTQYNFFYLKEKLPQQIISYKKFLVPFAVIFDAMSGVFLLMFGWVF